MDNQLRLTSSKRGGDKLTYNGFIYTKHRMIQKEGIVWRCDLRGEHQCWYHHLTGQE